MRILVVYKENNEYSRSVEEFLHDYGRQTGHKIETLDPDTAEGTTFCQTYDITQYPTLMAISDDGQVQQVWQGLPLPTISEVSYYA